jgi:hypothetical protein
MKIIKAAISGLFTLALLYALNSKFGDIPPLAKFLDPFNGFWANAESKVQDPEKDISPQKTDYGKWIFRPDLQPEDSRRLLAPKQSNWTAISAVWE